MSETIKYLLDESQLPKRWYNIQADLPKPVPAVLHPGTHQPIGPSDLAPLFPPSPLYRARRLEAALNTPAKIYYKYEGVSPSGSHKPNTAIPQAFYNREAGIRRLSTETGAGQWGSSLAFAGRVFGLEVQVFMVRVSYEQKPYRRALMETYGASCIASPSDQTWASRSPKRWKSRPNATTPSTRWAACSTMC